MATLNRSRLTVGALTLAVWALAAGSALYWGLRAGERASGPVAATAGGAPTGIAIDPQAVARALGATPAASAAPAAAAAAPDIVSRLALRGVVTHGGRGAALIAVDGKPAQPVRVGATVADDWRLKSVSPRAVVIANNGREASLNMPPLAARSSAGDAAAPPRPPPPITPPPLAPPQPAAMPPLPPPMGAAAVPPPPQAFAPRQPD